MRAVMVMIVTLPVVMTAVRITVIITKIMPVVTVVVEIVIEPPVLTGVAVLPVLSGHIIGPGLVIRNLF